MPGNRSRILYGGGGGGVNNGFAKKKRAIYPTGKVISAFVLSFGEGGGGLDSPPV